MATKTRRGFGLKLMMGGVIALVILWCGYWYAVSTIAASAIEVAITWLAASGQSATCVEQRIGGFPLSFDLVCTDPAYMEKDTGLSVEFEGLRASAPLYWPGEMIVDLAGPLALELPNGAGRLTATWSNASASIEGGLRGLSSFAANLTAFSVEPSADELLPVAGLVGRRALISASSSEGGDYRFALAISNIDAKLADGSTLREVGAEVDLAALRLGSSLGMNPGKSLRDWLQSGSTIRVDRFALSIDRSGAAASGTLTLSKDGLLSGAITVSLIGLDGFPAIAELFLTGTRDRVAEIVGTVRGTAKQVKQDDETAYEIPLHIRDGIVAFGAIQIGKIPALNF